jgi:hypothetical protein
MDERRVVEWGGKMIEEKISRDIWVCMYVEIKKERKKERHVKGTQDTKSKSAQQRSFSLSPSSPPLLVSLFNFELP